MEMAEVRKQMTLDELRAKTAKAEKEATTFEKTPTLDVSIGQTFLFRVVQVIEGNFPTPMVIAQELKMGNDKGFSEVPVKAYVQDGKDGPKEFRIVNPGEKVRIPPFIVRHAMDNGTTFHLKLVYWAKFIGEKEVPSGTFKNSAVLLVGDSFPEGT